ncbi:MAG: addiction module protein [Thermodesulfobacteriota bacterium]|nr:addiction module protein [Thermodesulfobacteriota bacterium]
MRTIDNSSRDNSHWGCYISDMNSINQILQEASRLPEDQRLTLVNQILTLGEPQATADNDHLWDLEIRERIARYDRGETTARSASEVFTDLDRRLKL